MIYVWKCKNCDTQVDVMRPMAECKRPPESDDETCKCETPEWVRIFTPAMITNASYPDGVRKFTELREAHKLEKEARRSQNKETKKEIAAEIRKMGVRVKK